ncbi:MAG: DUF6057 family protein [Pirellulales bacterium]
MTKPPKPRASEKANRVTPQGKKDAAGPRASSPLGTVVGRVGRTHGGKILAGLFFLLFYLDVLLVLQPQVIYHGDQVLLPSGETILFPVYFQGTEFLSDFFGRPGGLAEYVAACHAQYYYYPYLGAVVLTVVGALACFLADAWIKGLGGTASRSLRFVPPLAVLAAYNGYTFRLEDLFAILAALAMANLYLLAANRSVHAAARFALFALVAPAVYYVAAGPYLLFAVLCAAVEVLSKGRRVLALAYALAAAGVPLWGVFGFGLSYGDAYTRLSGVYPVRSPVESAAMAGLAVFFVLAAVVLPFREKLAAWAARRNPAAAAAQSAGFWATLPVALVVIAGPLVAVGTLDREARWTLRANYLARTEQWGDFLQELGRYPSAACSPSLLMDANRALYETSRLSSEMFSYPQDPAFLFQVGPRGVPFKGSCEVLLRLGRANEAEYTGFETLEMTGEHPQVLRGLAMVFLVKQQPETARVFLGRLSRDLVHGPAAKDFLQRLEGDPLCSTDRQIGFMRALMPSRDAIIRTTGTEDLLLSLLAANPQNRMAFEYLMAHYLLTRQPEKVVANLGRLADFNFRTLPEHYAEAVLIYASRTRQRPDLHGWSIPPQTAGRFKEFLRIVQSSPDQKTVAAGLAAKLPNSYFRYFATGQSGGAE